jgi:hypothetical protein
MDIYEEGKHKAVVIRLLPALHARIKRHAEADDESMNTTIKRLLREALDRRESPREIRETKD